MANGRRKLGSRDLMETISMCIAGGRYLDTRHAQDRRVERNITYWEMLYVLKTGRHEKRKDRYIEGFCAWNYAIRGKTPDDREIRVIVSFDEDEMSIITAIDLSTGD